MDGPVSNEIREASCMIDVSECSLNNGALIHYC